MESYCAHFGCGKKLTLVEKLCGIKCTEHLNIIKTVKKLYMGDMAEYYADLSMLCEDDIEEFNGEYYDDIFKKYLKNKLYWKTKKDEKILIQKMENFHLTNLLKHLRALGKDNFAVIEWLDVLETEFSKRTKTTFNGI